MNKFLDWKQPNPSTKERTNKFAYSYKGILLSKQKEWATKLRSNRDDSQNHYAEWKEARHKRVHNLWFHIVVAKLIYGRKEKQNRGCLWRVRELSGVMIMLCILTEVWDTFVRIHLMAHLRSVRFIKCKCCLRRKIDGCKQILESSY